MKNSKETKHQNSIVKPLVSVLMTVYNAEQFLAEAIESILSQTYDNFEFIIVEDCSTDASREIILSYAAKDKRIKTILHSENKKINYSRKEYLQFAKGKYCAVLDADDVAFPERLEKQVNYLEANPDIYLVGTDGYRINDRGEIIGNIELGSGVNFIHSEFEKKHSLVHSSIMFRNTGEVEYREKSVGCEDLDMMLNLILKGKKLDNISEKLIKYRISSNSDSVSKFIIQRFNSEEILRIFLKKKYEGIDEYSKLDLHRFDYLEQEPKYIKETDRHNLLLKFKTRHYAEFRSEYFKYIKKYTIFNKLLIYFIISYLPQGLINQLVKII